MSSGYCKMLQQGSWFLSPVTNYGVSARGTVPVGGKGEDEGLHTLSGKIARNPSRGHQYPFFYQFQCYHVSRSLT